MGPRSIPKRHGKHQNFKAAAWRLTLGVFIPLRVKMFSISCSFSKKMTKSYVGAPWESWIHSWGDVIKLSFCKVIQIYEFMSKIWNKRFLFYGYF